MVTASVLLTLKAAFVKNAILVLRETIVKNAVLVSREKIVAVKDLLTQTIPHHDVIANQVITFLKTNFKMHVKNKI